MRPIDKSVRFLLPVMLIAVYCTPEAYADEDKGFSFPAARPEQVGMNQAKLEQAKGYAQSAGGSGMIVRHGRVVLRWGDQKKRYDIKSAIKKRRHNIVATPFKKCLNNLKEVYFNNSPARTLVIKQMNSGITNKIIESFY